MEFSEWLTDKYVKWRGSSVGRKRTIQEFATHVGVSQPLMSQWMKKGGKKPTSERTISKLVEKFGYEVFDYLDVKEADLSPVDFLPLSFRIRLMEASTEVIKELKEKNVSFGSPDGDDIAKRIFDEHGFRSTDPVRNE